MRYLLDTHALLWFQDLDPNLSSEALAVIRSGQNECWVSYATVFEISIKISLQKLQLPLPITEFVEKKIVQSNFKLLQIKLPHLTQLSTLPWHHRDPFDRLLIAQALSENLTLVSGDRQMKSYPVHILW